MRLKSVSKIGLALTSATFLYGCDSGPYMYDECLERWLQGNRMAYDTEVEFIEITSRRVNPVTGDSAYIASVLVNGEKQILVCPDRKRTRNNP